MEAIIFFGVFIYIVSLFIPAPAYKAAVLTTADLLIGAGLLFRGTQMPVLISFFAAAVILNGVFIFVGNKNKEKKPAFPVIAAVAAFFFITAAAAFIYLGGGEGAAGAADLSSAEINIFAAAALLFVLSGFFMIPEGK